MDGQQRGVRPLVQANANDPHLVCEVDAKSIFAGLESRSVNTYVTMLVSMLETCAYVSMPLNASGIEAAQPDLD